MFSTRDQILAIPVPLGQTRYVDCLACGGKRKLGITNKAGAILYNCFRNSCTLSGAIDRELDKTELRGYLAGYAQSPTTQSQLFEVPKWFTNALASTKSAAFIQKYNLEHALDIGLADIRYDPRQDRIVFMIKHQGVIQDAVGRSLCGESPKWLRYGSSEAPYICGSDDSLGILVEDAVSATVASSIATGVALLGTNLQPGCVPFLKRFSSLVVALDKDASKKALAISKTLTYLIGCKVHTRLLDDDLKDVPPDMLRNALKLNH